MSLLSLLLITKQFLTRNNNNSWSSMSGLESYDLFDSYSTKVTFDENNYPVMVTVKGGGSDPVWYPHRFFYKYWDGSEWNERIIRESYHGYGATDLRFINNEVISVWAGDANF